MRTQANSRDLNRIYLSRLTFLVQHFENERRERFYPFFILFKGETEHPRFREALGIARYFLDNMCLNTEADELFLRTSRKLVEKYEATDLDYWYFAETTPIPMQDYLKVVYDLREASADSETALT